MGNGGGIFVAVAKKLKSTNIEAEAACEIVWARLTITGGNRLAIGSFYRSPDSTADVTENFRENLGSLVRMFPEHTIIIGSDFNHPSVNWDSYSFASGGRDKVSCETLLNSFSENYLEQMVRNPTHDGNILHLAATNRPDLFEEINTETEISISPSV